jgi:hypothetical protein
VSFRAQRPLGEAHTKIHFTRWGFERYRDNVNRSRFDTVPQFTMEPTNTRWWRKLAVLMAVALLVQMANSQERLSVPQTTTFTAPDRTFLFSYPSDFQVCKAGKIEPCLQSFMPVCEGDALVCVIYPTKQFEGTNFGAASFQVREIHREEMMTPDVCATPYPLMDSSGPWRWPEFFVSA